MGSVRDGQDRSDLAGRQSNTRDPGWIPGWGRPPQEGKGNPVQKSCLKNLKDRTVWWVCSPWGHKRVGTDLATKRQQKHPVSVFSQVTGKVN